MVFVEFKHVSKKFRTGEIEIVALQDVCFSIGKGELVVIVGPSGAGKTTILNMLGGMDQVTTGEIIVGDEKVSHYPNKKIIEYRRESVGFVFQFYNLVPNLTAKENIELAAQICNDPLDAIKMLQQVGLEKRFANFPSQLSGGEQQRVAIARALTKNPQLVLCDEPTGALDYETGKKILKVLQDTSRILGKTVVIITHNSAFEAIADRVIRVNSGHVVAETINSTPVHASEVSW